MARWRLGRAAVGLLGLLVLLPVLAMPACGFERGTLRERLEQRRESREQGRAPGDAAGLERHTLISGGVTRSYDLFVPPQAGNRPLPLVVVFHGGHGTPERIAETTQMHALAAREGFVVAYPAAMEKDRIWNDGRATTASDVDDVAFIDAMLADIRARHAIDATRIFATGLSSGGMFTLRLACERASVFRAFAPVVANLPVDMVGRCRPSRPVPMLLIQGEEDPLMPFAGGEVRSSALFRRGGGNVISSPDTARFFARMNGCASTPVTERLPDTVPDDGTQVEVDRFAGCRNGADVIGYRVIGGGHTWPGSAIGPALRKSGATSREISATETIWQFFQRF
jgi:polyhydroxybutyrate depolymerase